MWPKKSWLLPDRELPYCQGNPTSPPLCRSFPLFRFSCVDDSTSSSFMSWQRHQETLWVAVLSRLYRDRIRSISGPGDTELITLVSNPRKFRFHVKLCSRPTSYMQTCAYSHGLWLVSIVTLWHTRTSSYESSILVDKAIETSVQSPEYYLRTFEERI